MPTAHWLRLTVETKHVVTTTSDIIPLQMVPRPFIIGCTSAVLMATMSSCEPPGNRQYRVTGTVTLDSQPLADGTITLGSVDGTTHPNSGKIIDGHFDIMAYAGDKKVVIIAPKETGEVTSMGPIKAESLSPRYNRRSILVATIQPDDGANLLKIELTSQAAP